MKNSKSDLANLIQGLSAVSIGAKALVGELSSFKSVAVVGSSCSGKTTLINEIRKDKLYRLGKVAVPLRYITRPKRKNDLIDENIYISQKEFLKKVKMSQIYFRWKKRLDSRREEMFGFNLPVSGTMPVYSGNNGLLYNKDTVYPRGILDTMIFVGVYAPDEVRKERLFIRSPDLVQERLEELEYRLEDSSEKMVKHVHFVVNNYGAYSSNSSHDFLALLGRMLKK